MIKALAGAGSTTPLRGTAVPDTQDRRLLANNRAISSVAKLLNDSRAAGADREFSIAIDPKTREAVVRIVDRDTHEVVEQLPSEYLLRVARQISDGLAKQSPHPADKTV